jgi:AcrR family transcriptional regulator
VAHVTVTDDSADLPVGTRPGRPLRRDAELNRQKILSGAADIFAARGLDVPLDDIAAHVGVGVGTMYRRFPDKDSLIEALFEDKIDRMVALAQEAAAQQDAWTALVGFLRQAAERQAADQGLRQVMHSSDFGKRGVGRARARLTEPLTRLVAAAKEQGTLRHDFQLTDIPMVLLMTGSVAQFAQDAHPDVWRRALDFVVNGLGERPGLAAAQCPALTDAELVASMKARRRL